MSKIEKIKSKIEERIALAEKCANAACEKNLHNTLEANELLIRQYKSLLDIIDSISEEKPSEDLEEAANKYAILDEEGKWKDGGKYKGFIAGAEWQKQRDAELIEIAYNDGITIGKTKQKEQMIKDSEEDVLLLERAWLTLNHFGHEELAERLKTFKEKYANKM